MVEVTNLTGFPGPNGAGKTTTTRVVLGLAQVGDLAADAMISLSELTAATPTEQLEGLFLQLTGTGEEVAS